MMVVPSSVSLGKRLLGNAQNLLFAAPARLRNTIGTGSYRGQKDRLKC